MHDLTEPVYRNDLEGTSWWWLVLLAGWLVGRYVGSRRAAADLERRTRALEEERRLAEAAVQEERARIARELHDVVAHSVSVVAVEAGAAQAVLATDPDRARRPLGAIETSARDALVDMRRLLGVLRTAEEEPSLAPQAGLADLPAVAARVTAAGRRSSWSSTASRRRCRQGSTWPRCASSRRRSPTPCGTPPPPVPG